VVSASGGGSFFGCGSLHIVRWPPSPSLDGAPPHRRGWFPAVHVRVGSAPFAAAVGLWNIFFLKDGPVLAPFESTCFILELFCTPKPREAPLASHALVFPSPPLPFECPAVHPAPQPATPPWIPYFFCLWLVVFFSPCLDRADIWVFLRQPSVPPRSTPALYPPVTTSVSP